MPPGSELSSYDVSSDGHWHRLHPLTPILRSWRIVAPLAVALAQSATGLPVKWAVLVVAVVLALAVVGGYLSWRTTRYRVAGDVMEVHTGILRRQRRRLPISRVESVDIKRGLLARALGLAELQVEAVSTGGSELALAYLSDVRATSLRATLLARRAGVAPDSPAPAERVLAAVPVSALVTTAVLVPAITLVVVVAAAVAVAIFAPAAGFAVLLAMLPPVGIAAATTLVQHEALYGFTVAAAPDGLRIRRGLLNLRTQTIPHGRVQAVRIQEPLLWRHWGWVRLYVDVAGYIGADRSDRAQTSMLMPVAPRSLVAPLLAQVMPGVDLSSVTLVPAPASARWRAPLSHRWLGAGWTGTHCVTRSGVVRRITDVVPHRKVQSLRVTQGWWQRLLGLASVHVDTPGQTVRSMAEHRGIAEALDLVARSRVVMNIEAG